MYDLEKQNLRLFSSYIVHVLRPSYMKVFLNEYLGKEDVEQILSQESRSVTLAAKMLLEKMMCLEEVGWFQAFLDTLHASEYTGLHAAVNTWDFQEMEALLPLKTLLERVEPSITKNMKPSELLPHMSDCLTQRDCEEIRAVQEQRGCVAASECLVDILKRSDKPNWFKVLKLALDNCNQRLALDLLEPGTLCACPLCCLSDGNEKCMMECEESSDTMATVCFEYHEDGESDMGLLKSSNDLSLSNLQGNTGTHTSTEKKLRDYQRELTTAACNGQNTIICAPTGCGKTIVALMICEDHLKKFPGKAKVVFMATKVEVYDQQYKLFLEHFSKDPDIRVTGVCGDMELCVQTVVECNDIVVLTPQILVNALQRGELLSLQVFTLLILDECHNTTGKHPYNNLMGRYLDAKLGPSAHTLPQVVGLTASVGIGTFKNQLEAENNICQLCANLDARVISTVTKHIDELRSYVHIPDKEFYLVPPQTSNPFIEIITGIMSNIEQLARTVYNIESLSPIQNREYGSQKYEQWIVEVQKRCKLLQLQDPEEEKRMCRALYNYTEHLRKYNDALIIYEDARAKDALVYLQAFIQQVRNAGYGDTESHLAALLDSQWAQLQHLATEGQENPKLQELKFILDEEYHNNDQTRTVLFVRTRALTDALKNWIEETDSLNFLKPGILIGRGRKSHLTGSGMTLTSQKGVLDSFKSSDQSKILIATSVADEGIDIPQCNLVIMYEYVGNVVKMVQVRGRGRAQGSRCFLISSSKERIDKEKLNMQREEVVEKAIASLQSSPEDLRAKVDVFQREEKARRAHVSAEPERPHDMGSYQLLCAKCRHFACFSSDLRVLQEAHHIILDRSVFNRCETKPHGKPKTFDGITKTKKLLCGNCKMDWGIIASYLNIQNLPVVKIESFVIQNIKTQQIAYFRKWKDVTFALRTFDLAEMSAERWGP
uniref:RNA helicase n=1 Tax=Electrophorus electricus TaxID=8005 RepID=A0A4W4GQC3_ELEEL